MNHSGVDVKRYKREALFKVEQERSMNVPSGTIKLNSQFTLKTF